MSKKKKETIKLSYESDGKMGEKSIGKQEKSKEVEFFNSTQSSE